MNKYERFKNADSRTLVAVPALSCIESERLAARMHKPGYRRKMRRSKTKYAKHTSH